MLAKWKLRQTRKWQHNFIVTSSKEWNCEGDHRNFTFTLLPSLEQNFSYSKAEPSETEDKCQPLLGILGNMKLKLYHIEVYTILNIYIYEYIIEVIPIEVYFYTIKQGLNLLGLNTWPHARTFWINNAPNKCFERFVNIWGGETLHSKWNAKCYVFIYDLILI